MAVLDEPDLTAALRGLARRQPVQPDRLPAVAERVRRVRRRRTTLAAAAAAVVVAVPVALAGRDAAPPVPPAPEVAAATPLQHWPERSRPGREELAEQAVQAWRDEISCDQGCRPRSRISLTGQVRWLFRGPVPVGGRPAYAAVFLAGSGPLQEVVTAMGRLHDDDRPSWEIHSRRAATAGSPSGAYLPDEQRGSSTGFVLADPAARSLTWTVDPLPGSPGTDGPGQGTATSTDGVFAVRLPELDGRVRVRTAGPGLPAGEARPLGDGDPPLVELPDPEVPGGERSSAVTGGQGEPTGEGSYTGTGVRDATGWPTGAEAYASCYGEASLVVVLQGGRTTVPCDGRTHPAGRTGPTDTLRADATVKGLLSYRLALVRP